MLSKKQEKIFYIVTLVIFVCIISFVITFSKQHKYRTLPIERRLINVPRSTKEKIPNSYSRLNACSSENVYKDLPDFSFASETNPLKSELIESKENLTTSLKINDFGKLIYSVNGFQIWNSEKPRVFVGGAELNLLKNYASLLTIDEWKYSEETRDGTRLHLTPLSITKNDINGKRKLLWSFLSGWDPASVSESSKATIPVALKKSDSATYILISQNRKKRVALSSNGDLLTMECGATDIKENFSISLFKSLMQSYC